MRLGFRRIRTKGRVGISKSIEIDLINPQTKTEIHEDTNFCLDKIKHSIVNCIKGLEMLLENKLNEKVVAS